MHASLTHDDLCWFVTTQMGGEAGCLRRCRHRQQAQVRPHRGGDLEGEGEAEIGGEVALVDLVEDHRRHPR